MTANILPCRACIALRTGDHDEVWLSVCRETRRWSTMLELCREYKIIRAFLIPQEFTDFIGNVVKIIAKVLLGILLVCLRPIGPASGVTLAV